MRILEESFKSRSFEYKVNIEETTRILENPTRQQIISFYKNSQSYELRCVINRTDNNLYVCDAWYMTHHDMVMFLQSQGIDISSHAYAGFLLKDTMEYITNNPLDQRFEIIRFLTGLVVKEKIVELYYYKKIFDIMQNDETTKMYIGLT